MNTSVNVTGMQVKTKVSSNLFVAEDTLTSTDRKAEDLFGTALEQEVKGLLEPVSTINGTSFFYTLNAKANGAKESGDYVQYDHEATATNTTSYANKFSEDYGITSAAAKEIKGDDSDGAADAYVDYVFQLKAVATEASYINLTKAYLIDSNAKDASKAHRIAIFVEDISEDEEDVPSGSVGTKQIILTESDAANQTSGKAVSSTTATADVSYNSYADATNKTLIKIEEAGTKYYKVVARLWLEGEDTTCYNDMFLALSEGWALDLELNLSTTNTEATKAINKIWTAKVSETDYWYDGTSVYTTLADAKAGENGTAKASAAEAVRSAFGIA